MKRVLYSANMCKKNRRLAAHFSMVRQQKHLILLTLPGFLLILIFHYFPIYGLVTAFMDYRPLRGIMGSKWVGMKHFISFFSDPLAIRTIRNTLVLGVYSLVITFPAPIVLALLLDEIQVSWFKRVSQTIFYLPHFISTVVVVGMMKSLFTTTNGLVNDLIVFFGGKKISFFSLPEWFRTLYIGSSLWQGLGWGTIIYLAALSGVDVQLYEAATIDGANRFQRVINVTLPSIAPTVSIMLILAIGGIMGNDMSKILLMYSPSTYETADVISTYVYRKGLIDTKYGYSSAVGLFNSMVSFVLVLGANVVSRKISETSLW